jgi:hypothetical protein
MLRLAFFVITVSFGATWAAEAETIDVKYYGKLDLSPFACTEITRSSYRACYDKAKQFMVVQLQTVYYPYCEMPPGKGVLSGGVDGEILQLQHQGHGARRPV